MDLKPVRRCAKTPVICTQSCGLVGSTVLLCLEDALMSEGFAIMDQNNLKKLPFFKWLGAIGIQKQAETSDKRSQTGYKF